MNGKTQTILGSSPAADQAEVLIAQDVMLDQTGAIKWDRFKGLTLRGGKKFTQRHLRVYFLPTTISPPARARSREIVAG